MCFQTAFSSTINVGGITSHLAWVSRVGTCTKKWKTCSLSSSGVVKCPICSTYSNAIICETGTKDAFLEILLIYSDV